MGPPLAPAPSLSTLDGPCAVSDSRTVLRGPGTPTWRCRCGEQRNWASRISCQSCGGPAPQRVVRKACEADGKSNYRNKGNVPTHEPSYADALRTEIADIRNILTGKAHHNPLTSQPETVPSQGPPKVPPPELFKRFLSDAQQLSEICGFDTDDPLLKKVVAGHKESLRAKDPTARIQTAAHWQARASGRTINAKTRAEGLS